MFRVKVSLLSEYTWFIALSLLPEFLAAFSTTASSVKYPLSYWLQWHTILNYFLSFSLFLSEFYFSKKELRLKRFSCPHVISSSLLFSLTYSVHLLPLSYDWLSDLLPQVPFFFFAVFHFSFWNISLLLCSLRRRFYLFFFVLSFMLILFAPLYQRLVNWKFAPFFFLIPKVSPFLNLSLGSASFLFRRNFFFGKWRHYGVGLILLFICTFILDILILLCLPVRSALRKTHPLSSHLVHIN